MARLADPAHSTVGETAYERRLVRRWVIIFILFGLLWRLIRFALAFPIWGDEAMLGLNVIGRSYAQLLQPLNYGQVAPFGFLWMLRFTFDRLGISDYTTRLPALLAGIGALLLFWQWAQLLISRQAAMLATGIVAVSGYIVRHGVEMKPYALDFLAALLLLLPATHYLYSRRAGWLIALILVVPVCSVISYPQVFIAGGIAVALLLSVVRENWTARILSALYCLILVGSFLAVIQLSGKGQYHHASQALLSYWHAAFPPANPLKFIQWFVQIHSGNLFAYPAGGKNGASLATVFFFGIGMWAMWRKWTSPIRLLLVMPFLLTFVAAALRLYPYGESARVSQHLAPIIILAAGAGIAVLVDRASSLHDWRMRLNIAASVLLGIGLVCLAGNIIWPYKREADQRMRTTVRSLLATASSDPILVLQPEAEAPATLRWYLHERKTGISYAATPSLDAFEKIRSAWVITCVAANAHLGVELAHKAQMKWTLWSRQDLQIGPKENGPTRLEIIHLLR